MLPSLHTSLRLHRKWIVVSRVREHSLHNAAMNVLNSTPTTLHSRQSVSFSLRLREHFFGKVIDAAVTMLVNTVPFDQIYLFFPGQAIDMQTSSIKPWDS